MSNKIIVVTMCDNKDLAYKIQDELLEKRLIAGCQISERESTYHWNGKLKTLMNIT